jgi:PST family polysaccharide transporter
MLPQLKRIARNAGWLMLDRLLRMLLGVTVGAWIARHLGPETFGALAYVIAFLALFQTASLLGLDHILSRELPKEGSFPGQLLGTSLRLRVGAGVLGWCAACFVMSVVRVGDSEALLLTVIIGFALVLQPADLIDLWFQSQSQSRRAVLPRVISFGVVSAIRVILIRENAALWTFAAAYLVESILALGLLFASYRRITTFDKWSWHTPTAYSLVRQAAPLMMSGLAIIIYMRIDQILLRALSGDHELGLYSAVLPFSQAWYFIPSTICASAAPFLVRWHQDDTAVFLRRTLDLFTVLAWGSLGISILVALCAGPIVRTLLGPAFGGAAGILTIHVFSNVPVFLGIGQLGYLVTLGRTKVVFFQTIAGMSISIAMNLLLIPTFGARGSAVALVVAQVFSAFLCNAILAPDLFKMQCQAWLRLPGR